MAMPGSQSANEYNTMSKIIIKRQIANQLLTHAQSSPEAEICGLIGIDKNNEMQTYSIPNIAEKPSHFFNMNPKLQIDAMRNMRKKNQTLFGIYHSHPSSPAKPSVTDLENATYPEANYFIISLNTTGVLEIRAYRICNKQFIELTLSLSDE